jgi:phosphoribosylformylglycinamidine synthase subunit PurL
MALAGGVGVTLEVDPLLSPIGWFFGEDQGRYLLGTDAPERLLARAAAAGEGAGRRPGRRRAGGARRDEPAARGAAARAHAAPLFGG